MSATWNARSASTASLQWASAPSDSKRSTAARAAGMSFPRAASVRTVCSSSGMRAKKMSATAAGVSSGTEALWFGRRCSSPWCTSSWSASRIVGRATP